MNMPVKKNPVILNPSQIQFKGSLPPTHPVHVGPEIRTMPRALFDQQQVGTATKGTGQRKAPEQRSIGDRVLRQGIGSRRSVSEKPSSVTISEPSASDDDEGEFPYRVAAKSTLDSMLQDDSHKNREEIMVALAKMHEPLQQYTVLFGAMKEIERRTDIDPLQKVMLKNSFNEMMTDLVSRDRNGIRKGLREGSESSPVAAKIESARISRGLPSPIGLRNIRFMIGARAKGGIDEELTAMVMIKTLIKNVGAAYTEEAMHSVCSRLMPSLRTFSPIKEAAYMLTVSDAMTFSIVRSGFNIAKDLKRELMDKAEILCKLHHVEVAVVLFTAAEQGWGKGKGSQLVNQLFDLKNVMSLPRGKAFKLIHEAIGKLPLTAWPHEKQSSRSDLLDDIYREVHNAYDEIPRLTTKAERMEEEWRNQYAAGRAPTLTEHERTIRESLNGA